MRARAVLKRYAVVSFDVQAMRDGARAKNVKNANEGQGNSSCSWVKTSSVLRYSILP